MQQTILLVDDEELFRERLATAFRSRGYIVFTAAGCDEALVLVAEHHPAMAVVDLKMPGKSGLSFVEAARDLDPDLRMVVLTGYGSIATATEAVLLGALAYLAKPAGVDDILSAFARDPQLRGDIDPQDFTPPSLARVEWEHINRVLADCDGNISTAARKLGLHRRTLQRKLFKFAPKE